MMQPRDYQQSAFDRCLEWLEQRQDSPLIELPTGAGKTPVIALLARWCRSWGGRVMILAHVKELLAQGEATMRRLMPMEAHEVGVYSAGMGRRESKKPILLAGVQSVYNKMARLGPRDLIIVDECHLMPPGGDGMYQQALAGAQEQCPHARLVGLTATPYRLDSGLIYGDGQLFGGVCYRKDVKELIEAGYLSKLRGKMSEAPDLQAVHTRGGDFIIGELDEAMADAERVEAACDEIMRHCADRKHWLVFCSGVKHATMVNAALEVRGVHCELLTGETPRKERDDIVARLKGGELRAVVNVNVASIGFDAPCVDAVVLLRPTQSPGLYYQQVGRGLRIADGKADCLILDLAGNIERHGPIDIIVPPDAPRKSSGEGEAPVKRCPACEEMVPAASTRCPACDHEFPPRELKHETRATDAQPISGETVEQYAVDRVAYGYWQGKDGKPDTMRVRYYCGVQDFSEWVCLEHEGFARHKAERWWKRRAAGPCPDGVHIAVACGNAGELREPRAIRVKIGSRWPEIVEHLSLAPRDEHGCPSCHHWQDGYCALWEANVPLDEQESGCDSHDYHDAGAALASIQPDDECPF